MPRKWLFFFLLLLYIWAPYKLIFFVLVSTDNRQQKNRCKINWSNHRNSFNTKTSWVEVLMEIYIRTFDFLYFPLFFSFLSFKVCHCSPVLMIINYFHTEYSEKNTRTWHARLDFNFINPPVSFLNGYPLTEENKEKRHAHNVPLYH